MEKSYIDKLAYNGKELPLGEATTEDILYYNVVYKVYQQAKIKQTPYAEAVEMKNKAVEEFQERLNFYNIGVNLKKAYQRAVNINILLEKKLQPIANIEKKSKEELIEILLELKRICEGGL